MTIEPGSALPAEVAYRLWAATYDDENPLTALDQRAATCLRPSPRTGRLLDMGCGTARRLASSSGDGSDAAVGIDLVFEMLRVGRRPPGRPAGAAVDVGVVGRKGLVTQDYDQTVVVSGNPSGPITVAGALAGGPVGAAGALLISQLFKGQLAGLASVYYRVTGPWDNPKVERISASASGAPASGTSPDKEVRQ